jgi:polyisoprenyl-phosphate glycosyltransferase
VKLARNFGSMSAIQAGLVQATGDCVGMIAADLQDPPELFVDMLRHWRQGSKVVLAVRADRDEPLTQKLFAGVYYGLMRRFALPGYPEGGFDFFLIDRQVVEDLNAIREKNTNLMSLIFWMGFSPVMLPYVRSRREKGRSRWTLAKKIKLFVDSFIGFSYAPVRLMSVVGIVTAASAFAYALYVVLLWLFQDIPVRGYAPIVILIALTAGIQMSMLGVVGEYLWRMLDEVRRRPPYVVDWVKRRDDSVVREADESRRGATTRTEAAR